MTTLPGYYTAAEISAALDNLIGETISRQHVAMLAKKQKWAAYKIGNTTLYPEAEITKYLWAKQRTHIAKREGWYTGQRLIWLEDFDRDDNCPICGGFASYKINDLEGDEWACTKGHSSPNKANQGDG